MVRVGRAHTPKPVMGRLTPGLSEQGSEARLLAVPVVGERLGDVPLLRDEEACAVREDPCLVGPGGVARDGGPELGVRLRSSSWLILPERASAPILPRRPREP